MAEADRVFLASVNGAAKTPENPNGLDGRGTGGAFVKVVKAVAAVGNEVAGYAQSASQIAEAMAADRAAAETAFAETQQDIAAAQEDMAATIAAAETAIGQAVQAAGGYADDAAGSAAAAAQAVAAANLPAMAAGDAGTALVWGGVAWSKGGPYAVAEHVHVIADITGLQAAINGKAAVDLSNVSSVDFGAKASAAGVGGGFKISQIVTISGSVSITQAAHAGKALRVTSSAVLTFPAAGSFVGSCLIYNGSGVPITLAGGVNAVSSWVVAAGQAAIVVGDGSQYLATSGGPALNWDPAFPGAANCSIATLSADKMTASGGAAWFGARSFTLPAGNIYFEMHVIDGGDGATPIYGIDRPTYDGSHVGLIGRVGTQKIVAGSYVVAGLPSIPTGTVLGWAVAPDGRVWSATNNAWSGSPSAGTSPGWTGATGALSAFCRLNSYQATGSSVRLVISAAAMAYAPPAGFAAIQS